MVLFGASPYLLDFLGDSVAAECPVAVSLEFGTRIVAYLFRRYRGGFLNPFRNFALLTVREGKAPHHTVTNEVNHDPQSSSSFWSTH
jgi:hypothetical protein